MIGRSRIFRPEDTAFIFYLTAVSIWVTLFHRGIERWWIYVLSHSLAAVLTIAWVRYSSASERPAVRFLRYWYIPLCLAIFYEQIDKFILGLHGRYLDHVIFNFEKSLLGVHPSVWLERFASPVMTEVMKIGYHSYYWIGPILGVCLYLREDKIPFRRTLFSIMLAFFISYFGFILFPVIGPRYVLSDLYNGPLNGYFVTALQDWIMEHGDIYGGCMPSSHVAVALVVLMLAWTYQRRLAWIFTPLVTILSISTVYNRYHYVSDVFAGIIVGLVAFFIGKRIYRDSPEGLSVEIGKEKTERTQEF